MTVTELIKKLMDYNPNANVLIIKNLEGVNVGVETSIYYCSKDDTKENATEVYMGIQQVVDLKDL